MWMYVCVYVCVYVYVCMYVCMYACMCVCVYVCNVCDVCMHVQPIRSHNLSIILVCRYMAEFNGERAEERLPDGFLKVETLADTPDPTKLFTELFIPPLR